MGDADLQAWNALFTEAILAESLGLVDRPTALKGPDGQWQGMVKTDTGERRAIATVSKTHLLMSPGGFDEGNNVWNHISCVLCTAGW